MLSGSATAIADPPSSESKLEKQYSNQASEEFRQHESTASKIERTIETGGQQQFAQTSSVLSGSVNDNQSKLQNPQSTNVRDQQSTSPVGSPTTNNSKLQKQFSNQAREEFRQQESTANKLEKTIETGGQQQFAQTSSVLSGSVNDNQSKLQNPQSTNVRDQQSTSPVGSPTTTNKDKLQKQFSDKAREGFRQQESTAGKLEKIIETDGQKQLAQTAKASSKTNDSANDNFQKPKSSTSQRRFKLQTKQVAKSTLVATGSALKSGVEKYQDELEQGDAEGVTLASQGVSVTGRLTATNVRKLRQRRLRNRNFKKAKENPLHREKAKNESSLKSKSQSSLKKLASSPAIALKKGAFQYQSELEKDDEGVKLASQGSTQVARASKKLVKGIGKMNAQSGKLGKQNSKLTQARLNKNRQIKTESKAVLKKKAFKKKMYAPQRDKLRSRAFTGAMSSFSGRMSAMFKGLGKININTIRNAIGAKVATYAGAGMMTILPYVIGVVLVFIAIIAILGATSSQQQAQLGSSRNLSPEVEQWRSLVEIEAAAQGMEAYISLILAIIQVESGGIGTRDIMQSSESAGYPRNYFQTEEESVRQGIKHLKNIVNIVTPFGLENDYKLLAQAYNFGSAFAGYVGSRGGDYTLDVAEQYSRDVVAPSLGNSTGEIYSYVNATSQRLGKTYLYRNGGNYMYGELVAEYMGGAGVTGDFLVVVNELEKYLGQEYVWGGKNPSTGFDCSGFVSWGLAQIGITLPSYAASQYDLTVEINPSEAQPGDLIFFKGTYGGANHVSHVGFYIDDTTMLDSNGSGVGYHNWKDPYWQKHYAGIRRVVN